MCLYIRLSQFNIETFYPGLSLQFPGEADWLELLRLPLLCVTIRATKGTYNYDAIKRCQPLVWGNMTHDDACVETGVGGQAKYDVMMVFFGIALQKHHKTLKTSTRRYSDCHILHILNRYNK